MEARIPRLPPEQAEVVAWPRTPEGEDWASSRIRKLSRQARREGVFGHLIPDEDGWRAQSLMRMSVSDGSPP